MIVSIVVLLLFVFCFLFDTSIDKDIYASIIHNEYEECNTL